MFTTRLVTSTYWSLNIFQHPDLNIFFAYFGATIVRGYRLVRESQIKIVVGTLRTTTNDATFRVYRDNDFCRFLFLFFLGRSKEILEIGSGWEKVVIRLDWWEIRLKGSFYLWIKTKKDSILSVTYHSEYKLFISRITICLNEILSIWILHDLMKKFAELLKRVEKD